MNFQEFIKEKGLELESLKPTEMAENYNEFNEKKRQEILDLVAKKASQEQINDAKSQLQDQIDRQYKALTEMVTLSQKKAEKTNEVKSLKDAIEEKRADLSKLKEGEIKNLRIKAAADMLLSTNVSGGNVPQAQRLAGLDTIASRRVRLFDVVQMGTIEGNKIEWVSQVNKDGAAGQTAEGALKNQIDFDLVVNSETLKKTTAYIKVSKEMIDDVSYMAAEIENELYREVLKKAESQVYSGDGTGNNLNGITNVASAFAAGSFAASVDNANEVDVLVVASGMIEEADHDMATAIFVHPRTMTKLKLIKVSGTDSRYIDRLQFVAGQMSLDGIPIISTTMVTAGEYIIGNFDMAKVYTKGEIEIAYGYENQDFTKNMITVLAEWRGLVVVKNNSINAFVKGVFATDKAALETP